MYLVKHNYTSISLNCYSTLMNRVDVFALVRRIHKWTNGSIASIDSDNTKLSSEVNTLHNLMVHWMVQMLLRLAPNRFTKV